MTCINTIPSTLNIFKKLLLYKSLNSSYIKTEYNDTEEIMNNTFITFLEPLLYDIDHPALQQLAVMREEVLYVIFLDLHKAYDAFDRARSLYILEGYGVGPRTSQIQRRYWEKTTMVARVGGYYGTAFKGA